MNDIYKPNKVRILMVFLFALVIAGINAEPASARDDHDRGRHHDNGRYENRGRGYERNHHVRNRRVHRTTVYRERVYVAPPVFYAPPPPPGISFFLPSITIRP